MSKELMALQNKMRQVREKKEKDGLEKKVVVVGQEKKEKAVVEE